ncbi:MAG: toxin [Candidatus Aureabacteria bacterium]|nr:toxin [Candidatus Auribacterota bacterium]
MKLFEWDETKNTWLKAERKISFDEIVFYIAIGNLVDIVPKKNQKKYPGQRIFVVNIEGYIYLVPFDETESVVQLKTIIPSRKATKAYLGGK